jgi:hypothetical protein
MNALRTAGKQAKGQICDGKNRAGGGGSCCAAKALYFRTAYKSTAKAGTGPENSKSCDLALFFFIDGKKPLLSREPNLADPSVHWHSSA